MAWVCLLLLGLTEAATFNSKVSPVQKVLELLDDLKAKVKNDLANEEKMMSEYATWCDEESNDKEDAITSSTRDIHELSAAIEDASGGISMLSSEIDELTKKISVAESDLSSATYIRDDEKKAFEAEEKELVETVDTLARATVVLKRGQTDFLQGKGKKSKQMDLLTMALSRVVSASWVSSKEKAKVQALLQSEDEDLSLQPQATAAAYESKGSSILDMLGDLQAKAEDSLSTARRSEMEASHAYQMLKQSLDTETKQMQKRLAAATNEKAATEESKSIAEGDLAEATKSKATDTAYLKDLKQSCSLKAAEWAERQKSAGEEVAVIEKAKEILSSGVKVFLQVGTGGKAAIKTANTKDQQLKRDQISDIVRKLASKDHQYMLSQLSSQIQSDPFGKVKGLIESMVERLMKEAAEEADAKAFCDTEISSSRTKQKDLSATADMHTVRIEKASAAKAKLAEQIKTLNAEVAALDKGTAEATALRESEKAEFEKASAEYSTSAEAVANAIQVLQDYYANGAFVQRKQAPEFGGSKTDIGSTIVEMLEVAESDFTRLLAEANAAENSAAASYEKLSQQNAVARAAKVSEAEGKAAEVKSLEMSLLNYKEDRASTNKELDAVLTYLDKLKPQCETKVMSYAERKSRRESEISGLKEALEILEG
jgi:hypothetical protein